MSFFSNRKFARKGKFFARWSLLHLAIALLAGVVLAGGLLALRFYGAETRIETLKEGAAETTGQGSLIPPGTAKIGGPFSLTSEDGKPVSDKDFAGKYLLVYFGYTMCPDMCPTGLQSMTLTMDQLKGEADRVQPLFITVDPARDTPERIKDYDNAFSPKIIGLTGTADQIAAVAKEYQVYYKKGDGDEDYEVEHSSLIYLMDPAGNLVATFDEEADPKTMVSTLRKAWGEPQP